MVILTLDGVLRMRHSDPKLRQGVRGINTRMESSDTERSDACATRGGWPGGRARGARGSLADGGGRPGGARRVRAPRCGAVAVRQRDGEGPGATGSAGAVCAGARAGAGAGAGPLGAAAAAARGALPCWALPHLRVVCPIRAVSWRRRVLKGFGPSYSASPVEAGQGNSTAMGR